MQSKPRAATPTSRARALKTTDAANYLGVSPSLLRKFRMRAPGDPQDRGPEFIKVSPYLVVYEIQELDAWLNRRRDEGRAIANHRPAVTGRGADCAAVSATKPR